MSAHRPVAGSMLGRPLEERRRLLTRARVRDGLLLLLPLLLYVALLYRPLPYASAAQARVWIENGWWPWQFADVVLTGNSLGRAGVLAGGGLVLLVVQPHIFPRYIGRRLPLPTEMLGGVLNVVVPTLLVYAALVALGILDIMGPLPALQQFGWLLLGSLVVVILHGQLERHLNLSVYVFNSAFALAAYVAVPGRALLPAVLVALLLAFLLLARRHLRILVVEQETEQQEQRHVVIPYGDARLQRWLLFLWIGLTLVMLLLATAVLRRTVPMQSNAPPVLAAALLAAAAVWEIAVRRFWLRAHFSPLEMARLLQNGLWFIPGVRPGNETMQHLTAHLATIAGHWLLFLVITYLGLWLLHALGMLPPFSGGAFLLLVVVILSGSGIQRLAGRLRALRFARVPVPGVGEIASISRARSIDFRALTSMTTSLPPEMQRMIEAVEIGVDESQQVGIKEAMIAVVAYALQRQPEEEERERQKVRQHPWRALRDELGSIALHVAVLYLIALAVLHLLRIDFSTYRVDLALGIAFATWDVVTSGRLRLVAAVLLRRFHRWLGERL